MIKENPEILKVGEAYLKFDLEFHEANKLLIKDVFTQLLNESDSEYFKNRRLFKISIEFEKGSLKTRITLWGTMATICMGIANYGSFRSGLKQIVQDVKGFTEFVIDDISKAPSIDAKSIVRLEKRTGIPGRINDIYDRVQSLERKMQDLSPNHVQSELNSIKQEIANLFYLMHDNERKHFFNELPVVYSSDLPEPNKRRTNYLISRYGLKPNSEIEFIQE